MNERDLNKLSKSQLIKMLLNQNDNDKPVPKPKTGKTKTVPRNIVKQITKEQKQNNGFNFDNEIFQTENQSIENFKIVGIQNRENKKFNSYVNEYRIKIKKKMNSSNEIYQIFNELVRTVKKRRKLSENDLIRIVIQNEELPNAISTKFNKIKDFKLSNLDNVINILEYRGILLGNSKIIVQSVKVPTGKGRLYLSKDTISRKGCIITIKNDDTIV